MGDLKNKVILIGGNHHNGLGLARSFGVNGIKPYGVIVGEGAEHGFVRKSKYWAKTWAIKSDDEIVEFLLNAFQNEKEKPVVIPYSDGAAEEIDLNLDRLKEHFLLPSIGGQQGKIAELMDKQKQVEFAQTYGIPMAKSCVVDLNDIRLPEDMIYPCIVKPVVSAEGEKSDIRKCDTETQTVAYLQELREKGYHRFLVQEYLIYDTEYLMVGSISGQNQCWFNSKKIRVWPVVGGSSSCLQVTSENNVQEFFDEVRNAFGQVGYDGIFDVEALRVGEKIYLNEINWRNSGTIYSVFGSKVYYPVNWYYWKTGNQPPKNFLQTCLDDTVYTIDESLDLRHVACGNITLRQWLNDKKKARAFAIWDATDLKPTMVQYFHLLKELIKRHGVKNG